MSYENIRIKDIRKLHKDLDDIKKDERWMDWIDMVRDFRDEHKLTDKEALTIARMKKI